LNGQNLLDLNQLESSIKNIDVVFHIAAQADLTIMSKSLEDSREGVLRNVNATHNVAYLCAKYKKWLIYTSTVCVYGNQKKHPSYEDQTLPNPSELYSCSKYAAEWIVKGYGKNSNMPWTIERFATIYGPEMRKALGLYLFFHQAMNGESITIHGNGKQDRTLTFIDDLVEGIIAPLKFPKKAKNQVFNLTSKKAISAIQMAKDVKKITRSKSEIVSISQRENQIIREKFDTKKAEKLLSWKTKTSWEKGLMETYKWFKKHHF